MPCTVVSIYPKPISETKPGLSECTFPLAASIDCKTPQIRVIGDDIFRRRYVPLEENPNEQYINIAVPAKEVANAIVQDFIRASRLTSEDGHPGLFYVEGKYTAEEIGDLVDPDTTDVYLDRAIRHQTYWFEQLLKEADDLWQFFRQNKSIDDLHRMAARFFGVEREWMIVPKSRAKMDLMACPYCTFQVPAISVVCLNCKNVVNAEKYLELQARLQPVGA